MSPKPKISSKPSKIISETNIKDAPTELHISYRYLCTNNKKYSLDLITDSREKISLYNAMINKLIEYSNIDDFKKSFSDRSYKKHNHIHPINWKDPQIKEQCFTCLDSNFMEQIKDDCWQLGIDNHKFRVHGFFIENVFYIVWLDPNHNLYYSK